VGLRQLLRPVPSSAAPSNTARVITVSRAAGAASSAMVIGLGLPE
jgi:hypothetical protein